MTRSQSNAAAKAIINTNPNHSPPPDASEAEAAEATQGTLTKGGDQIDLGPSSKKVGGGPASTSTVPTTTTTNVNHKHPSTSIKLLDTTPQAV